MVSREFREINQNKRTVRAAVHGRIPSSIISATSATDCAEEMPEPRPGIIVRPDPSRVDKPLATLSPLGPLRHLYYVMYRSFSVQDLAFTCLNYITYKPFQGGAGPRGFSSQTESNRTSQGLLAGHVKNPFLFIFFLLSSRVFEISEIRMCGSAPFR